MNRRVQPELFVPGSAVVHHCATSCASRVVRPRRWLRLEPKAAVEPRDASKEACPAVRDVPRDGRAPLRTFVKPVSLARFSQQRDLKQGANAAHQSSVVGMLADSSSTGALHKCSEPRVQRSWQRGHSPHVSDASTRDPLRPAVAARAPKRRRRRRRREHDQERPAKTRKKLTAHPPQVSTATIQQHPRR